VAVIGDSANCASIGLRKTLVLPRCHRRAIEPILQPKSCSPSPAAQAFSVSPLYDRPLPPRANKIIPSKKANDRISQAGDYLQLDACHDATIKISPGMLCLLATAWSDRHRAGMKAWA
jgi:hypothetical protein